MYSQTHSTGNNMENKDMTLDHIQNRSLILADSKKTREVHQMLYITIGRTILN